jgi:predicted nucleic acid-binding protein
MSPNALTVSNTSPLTNLAVIGQLDLVRRQFGRVIVPAEVWAEMQALPHEQGRSALGQARADGWLSVVYLKDQRLATALLLTGLDAGESAAISLAVEMGASRLLMDERKGHAAATRLGVPVTGALGVLAVAKRLGHLTTPVAGAIRQLRSEAGFFITPSVEQTILMLACEV